MKIAKHSTLFVVVVYCHIAAPAQAQQSNTVVTITGPQESNVVSTIERFDPDSNRTNITTKTKLYQGGRLVEDRTERKGAVDLTAVRIYHEGQLVMFQAWDSKSKVTQRTFLRDGRAVVTEVSSKSGTASELILFHGKDESIVGGLKRDDTGELRILDRVALGEIQRGSKVGTEFMNDLPGEGHSTKGRPK